MTVRRFLFGLFLLCPLAEWPGAGYDILRLPLALALGATLLAAGASTYPGRGALGLLAVFSAQGISMMVTPDAPAGFAALLATGIGVAACLSSRGASREDAIRLLAFVAIVLLAVAVVQKSLHRPTASLLGNTNYAGAVAGILLPILAAGGPWGRLGAIAAGILLALSESRGGLLGAFVGMAVASGLLLREGRHREAVAAFALVLVVAVVGIAARPDRYLSSDRLQTGSVRIEIWKGAVRMAADRPLLGTGIGGFGASYPPYRSGAEAKITTRDNAGGFPEVEDAHSSWVQSWAEGGALGALAWLTLAALSAGVVLKAGPGGAGWAGAVAAFLVAGLFNSVSAHVAPVLLFSVALGFLEPLPGQIRRTPVLGAVASLLAIAGVWSVTRIAPDLGYHGASDAPDRVAALRGLSDWTARLRLGQEWDRQGRPVEAAEAYRDVLRKRPFQAVAMTNLAVALIRSSNDRAEAERWLLRAQDVAPHYYMTHYNLGLLRLHQGRWIEAREQYERAAALNEAYTTARYGVGSTYVAAGDLQGALPHFRRAREAGFDVGARLRGDFPAQATDPLLLEFQR